MIDTARITSGFDVELQLGAAWFSTALRGLNDNGVLISGPLPPPAPPDADVEVAGVAIIFDPGFDLRIDLLVAGFPFQVRAALELNDEGTELVVTTELPGVTLTVPFGVFDDLAGVPVLRKVAGVDTTTQPAIALLANMNIRASNQSGEPLPEDQHVARGDPDLAQSILPVGQDVVLGIGRETFARMANNVWHTSLRADDGTHPLPDEDDPVGSWSKVTMVPQNGRIRLRLEGDIPADSPIVDVVPDPHVTVTLDIVPILAGGNVTFEVQVDADVDTGLLGDLFAFLVGGLVGFIIGLIVGIFVGGLVTAGGVAVVAAVAAVITLEIVEYVIEGEVERRVRAEIDGEPLAPILTCQSGLVHEARPLSEEDDLTLGPLDTLPRSIPIFTDGSDPLSVKTILATSEFDELQLDGDGMALAGRANVTEVFQPVPAELVGRTYDGEVLESLEYRLADNTVVAVAAADAVDRMEDAELRAPLRLLPEPAEADMRLPAGRLVTTCLRTQAIRRKNTIITELQFTSGVDLRVADSIRLQDAGALVVEGLQLIHPKNANPYYRSFPDSSIDNNLESKPPF